MVWNCNTALVADLSASITACGGRPTRLANLATAPMIDIQSFLWMQGSEGYSGRTFRAALTTRLASVLLQATR
jgi:hypothetical protein